MPYADPSRAREAAREGYARKMTNPEWRARRAARKRQWCHTNPTRVSGYRHKHNLSSNYGLTTERYEEMLAAQAGVCAICERPERILGRSGDPERLSVDHDHTTGATRGLLCRACNSALGLFEDSPALLRAAAGYVETYGA